VEITDLAVSDACLCGGVETDVCSTISSFALCRTVTGRRRETLLVQQRLHGVVRGLDQQLLLAANVPVQAWTVDAGGVADVGHRNGAVAAVGDNRRTACWTLIGMATGAGRPRPA
jgi:hypothetical protein